MTETNRRRSLLPINPPFFYGWIIVVVSALIMFFSGPGQTYNVSMFIDSYISEFGWSRSTVSGMYSLGTLTAGLLMGFVGNFIDQRGHRNMTTIISLLFGLACLGMSFVSHPFMLLAGFFSIRLLGQGSMSLNSNTLVPQWFLKKRGRALSIASLGGVAGSALIPPLSTWIIETYGWRTGWMTWAFLLWIVMAPTAYFLIRNRPEDVELTLDNEGHIHLMKTKNLQISTDSWTVREVIKTRTFWLLLFCAMIPSAILTGLVFHQVSVMEQVGISARSTATVLSIKALIRLPMVIVAGQIADRVSPRYLQAGSMACLLATMIILYFTDTFQIALVYGTLAGITVSFQAISSGVIWPEYFGRHYLGSIRGVTMMAGVIGSALGPLPYGFAFDLFGGYSEVLRISMIFPVLGIVAALMAKPPKRNCSSDERIG